MDTTSTTDTSTGSPSTGPGTTPRTRLRGRLALTAAVATLATGGIAVATAGPGAAEGPTTSMAGDGQDAGRPAAGVSAASVSAVSCNGGRSISMQSKFVGSAFLFSTGSARKDVPGTRLVLRGPRRGVDTYLITYSAETRLNGAVGSAWMGLEAHVDGISVNPSDRSITGTDAWNANSAQFCVRLGPGRHRLQMKTYTSGSATSGWLDDYTTSVQRFE